MSVYIRKSNRRQLGPQTKLEALRRHIIRRDVYIDTIQVRVSKQEHNRVVRLLTGKIRHGRNKHVGDRLTHFIRVHQPTDDQLRLIAEFAPGHCVNRFEPAIDAVTDRQAPAYQLTKLIEMTALLKYRHKQRRGQCGTSIYANRRAWSPRNLLP